MEHRNGEIDGYKIRYKAKRRGSGGDTVVTSDISQEKTIDELKPATSYLVRVAASTINGTGPFSDWLSVTTLNQAGIF